MQGMKFFNWGIEDDRMHYVYGLVNPFDQQIFYIGQTHQEVGERLVEHIRDSANKGVKNRTVAQVLRKGMSPLIVRLQVCHGERETLNAEKWWITHGIQIGWPLVNHESLRMNGGFQPEPMGEIGEDEDDFLDNIEIVYKEFE